MSKKVTFNDVTNADGEQDRRSELVDVPAQAETPKAEQPLDLSTAVPAKEPNAYEQAMAHLEALSIFFGTKKDDQISKEYNTNPIHVHLVRELHDRKVTGREVHLSDGNIETLSILHKRLLKKAH